MRYLLLLIICFSCTRQRQKQTGQLKIILDYCKYSNEHPSVAKIAIFKDGNPFKEIDFIHKEEVTTSLPFGKYTIRYKSIYNILEKTNVVVNSTKQRLISLCIDKINYNDNRNTLLLDELKVGESLGYFFESIGCFHSDKGTLIVIKNKDNKYMAVLNNLKFTVSKEQYTFIREFEIELRCNHVDGCSTIDSYEIVNRNNPDIFLIRDASCAWRGFDNLIKKLNLKEKLGN